MAQYRKCENCRYLESEGYEYPESYCAAGVSEDDPHYDGDGCDYHCRTLAKRYREHGAFDFDITAEEAEKMINGTEGDA